MFVLGICYGLQLIVQRLGGEVRVGEKQEYGRMEIEVVRDCGLFGSRGIGDREVVWMSHGDEAVRLPEGFEVVARSHQGTVAAVENRVRRFYGLQYHPEVIRPSSIFVLFVFSLYLSKSLVSNLTGFQYRPEVIRPYTIPNLFVLSLDLSESLVKRLI